MSKRISKSPATLRCSFCGNGQDDVVYLIAEAKVSICNECVEICRKTGANALAANGAEAMTHPYNDGYTHEALHTTHVLLCSFDDHVLETRCAEQFPDVKAAADKAHQAMFDLYQLIGTKFEDDVGPPQPAGSANRYGVPIAEED